MCFSHFVRELKGFYFGQKGKQQLGRTHNSEQPLSPRGVGAPGCGIKGECGDIHVPGTERDSRTGRNGTWPGKEEVGLCRDVKSSVGWQIQQRTSMEVGNALLARFPTFCGRINPIPAFPTSKPPWLLFHPWLWLIPQQIPGKEWFGQRAHPFYVFLPFPIHKFWSPLVQTGGLRAFTSSPRSCSL